jgi:acetylornithine/N-succinyldiaminopimelate aminotransferase
MNNIERDRAFHMAVYARTPVTFVKGEGVHLIDEDGTRYLDMLAGIAVNAVGHCHPKVVEAITRQASTLDHVSNLYLTQPQLELAKRLHDLTGWGKVFFANSGAEANECALKLARRISADRHGAPRPKVVAALGGFHGRTFATLAATGQPAKHAPFEPLPDWFSHIAFNDVAAARAISEDTGAVILEIIQGEGGVIVADEDFLIAVRERCDQIGAVLILDEVQTGIGRTGSFWAFQQTPIEPDMVTVAKALGGGLPIGACIAKEHLADAFQPGDHATTFGGGPVVCAAALATLEVVESEGLIAAASERGETLKRSLSAVAGVSQVRGRGLLVGAVVPSDAGKIVDAMRAQGVIAGTAGPDVVRFAPPLVVSDADIVHAVTVFADAMQEVTA